jgi:hypothetical protein
MWQCNVTDDGAHVAIEWVAVLLMLLVLPVPTVNARLQALASSLPLWSDPYTPLSYLTYPIIIYENGQASKGIIASC